MRYEFINRERKGWPVRLMCKVLRVSRSGYYGYLALQKRKPDIQWLQLQSMVRQIAHRSRNSYGSRRMSAALQEQGFDVGRCQAKSLMREAGVQARYKRKFRVTTNSKHKQPIFENKLNRDFDPTGPNTVWASDITYIRTREGWLYLNVVVDLYSRKVVGWSLKPRLNSDLATDALRMAYQQRQPAKGLMHHSDRGVQYASKGFRSMLFGYRMKGSMSRKGNCWDNACVESFFGSLKSELVQWKDYKTREEAKLDIIEYITMFYNSERLHSYLGYRSPCDYEAEGA